ncbi:MAG TPA: AAA family ATPase [Gemmatales bacterium]|nr:AAA family ATPase [Gemmatales bacterium]
MKLKSVEVTDYKCIRKSNRFATEDITCLVGKNESGKTSMLYALYRLNPVIAEHGNFDVTDEYPRADVEEYRQKVEAKQIDPAIVISAEYAIEPKELAEIEQAFGKGVLNENAVTVSKGYANGLTVDLDVNEETAVKHLISKAGLDAEIVKGTATCKTVSALLTFLVQDGKRRDQLMTDARTKADALEDQDQKTKAHASANALGETQAAKQLVGQLTVIKATPHFSIYVWNQHLKKYWPKFLYFDEYYQMDGHINIEKLKERQSQNKLKDSDRPMLGLIELARLDLDKLLSHQRTEELISKLEGASNHLSKQILKYWSQNQHLHVKFDLRPGRPGDIEELRTGTNLLGRVHDSVHEVTTPLGTRSRGFVWFFSFLAWFSKQKKTSEPLILLLDEPGLFLHAKAQGDLLKYMEVELRPFHQVVYSTHSPFMVDPHQFNRVRIVEDKSIDAKEPLAAEERGSKVFTEVLEAGEGTLFPLQGALGYDIAQSLFVGPNCLIVEGVSDLLYLQSITGILEKKGRVGLHKAWTITPVGGSDKVPTFAALLGAQKGLTLATLIDLQSKDTQTIENLYKKRLLSKSHVLTFVEFTKAKEADIEDMFDTDFYLELVSNEYGKSLPNKKVQAADLTSKLPRILSRLEEHFEKSPMTGKVGFNHYRPARYFSENVGKLANKLSDESLNRFEEAFKRLNALLPHTREEPA